MTPSHLNALNSTLAALPVAIAMTRTLLPAKRVSATAPAGTITNRVNSLDQPGNKLAEQLKRIIGYDHHGLNE